METTVLAIGMEALEIESGFIRRDAECGHPVPYSRNRKGLVRINDEIVSFKNTYKKHMKCMRNTHVRDSEYSHGSEMDGYMIPKCRKKIIYTDSVLKYTIQFLSFVQQNLELESSSVFTELFIPFVSQNEL